MNFNNLNGYTVEDTAARTAIGSIDNNGKITDNDFKTKFGDNSNLVQAVTSCAKLDNNGKIPADLLTVDAMQYKGKWDASGGLEPPVPENGRSTGDFYIISKSGTIDGNTVGINDRIIYNGNGWDIIKTAVMSAEMLNMIYPVGCLYWSSNNTNPGSLFGGTWTRIKDTFIYAASDNDTVNAATSNSTITGGSKTVTLNSNQIPKHTHTVSIDSKTTTLPNHKHKITSLKLISAGSHSHAVLTNTASDRVGINNTYSPLTASTNAGAYGYLLSGGSSSYANAEDYSLTSGSNISGYMNYANHGSRGGSSNKYRIIKENGSHTHTLDNTDINNPNKTDVLDTAVDITIPALSGTANNDNISSSNPNSINIMPPYTVKYCWERTA